MEYRHDRQLRLSSNKSLRFWLLGIGTALLLLSLLGRLLTGHLLSTAAVKAKIQHSVVRATGIEVNWQSAGLRYFPHPAIVLKKTIATSPTSGDVQTDELRISIEALPLLRGDLRLARIELQQPRISLNLPATNPDKIQAKRKTLVEQKKKLEETLSSLSRMATDLELLAHDGQLSIGSGEGQSVSLENLDLKLGLSTNGPSRAHLKLQGEFSLLSIPVNGKRQTIKDAKLAGAIGFEDGKLNVFIDRLSAAQPSLRLSGRLASTHHTPGFTLNLKGSEIDVDTSRRTVLALAGHIPAVRGIFDYLRGGHVPQISLTSQGKTLSDLGGMNNMLIKGQLQQGEVSIPQIKLDLSEVDGNVLISEGVLQGYDLAARQGETKGHDGTLKVGLSKDNNIFNLELMLETDLAQVHKTLKQIVRNGAFSEEVNKIVNLTGFGTGKLILGDSLTDIKARGDITVQDLAANYQRVPFPISIHKGQLLFTENQINLKELSGNLGDSSYAQVNGRADWKEALRLELDSGHFDLALNEVYPWVASFDGAKEYLHEIKKIDGRLDLSTASLKGTVGNPAQWQYAAEGTIKAATVESPRLPTRTTFDQGSFKLNAKQLSFQNLKTASLDADLDLSGELKGFPQSLNELELHIDGTLGQDSALWLSDRYQLPEAYIVQTPLVISKTQLSWQPGALLSLKGDASISKGPDLSVDVTYRPEQLQLKQILVKDQHSDARIAFSHDSGEVTLDFTGILQHNTLQTLFVEQPFGKSSLQGDIAIKLPRAKQAAIKGHLTGENLEFTLPGGNNISIEQIALDAKGDQAKVDAITLLWNDRTWDSVKTELSFDQDQIIVNVFEGDLCGIKCPGVLTFAGTDLTLDFSLAGLELDVATGYSCLTKGRVKMTGTLDFSSQVSAQGTAEDLLDSLQGPLEMTFANGVVTQNKLLARTLEVLNITEIVKGKLPNLASTGFAYSTITVNGKFQDGKLLIEQLYMDGETLDVYGRGEIDLLQKTIDIELLAAPFKTVDSVVKKIPGVNYLLAGSLVAIPVSIKGDLENPKVTVVSASSVGTNLLELGERIIKSPLKLLESIAP